MVICASFSVLCDMRNATKELRLPPDDMRISDPKVSLHFPTIIGNYDVTTLIESLLFKHIHDELSTNGSQMFTARTIQEMHSLGYKQWENHVYNYYGNGFICGERNQREVKIIFIVHLNNIDKPNDATQHDILFENVLLLTLALVGESLGFSLVIFCMLWLMIETTHTLHTHSRSILYINKVFQHLLQWLVVIRLQLQPDIALGEVE
jgi:hypothetical protein